MNANRIVDAFLVIVRTPRVRRAERPLLQTATDSKRSREAKFVLVANCQTRKYEQIAKSGRSSVHRSPLLTRPKAAGYQGLIIPISDASDAKRPPFRLRATPTGAIVVITSRSNVTLPICPVNLNGSLI